MKWRTGMFYLTDCLYTNSQLFLVYQGEVRFRYFFEGECLEQNCIVNQMKMKNSEKCLQREDVYL